MGVHEIVSLSLMKRPAEEQATPENKDEKAGRAEGNADAPAATGSGSSEPAKDVSPGDFWKAQIEAVYQRRNPHKLSSIPSLLEKYKGREMTLYVKVCKTYDLDPTKFYTDEKAWEQYDQDVQDD